MTTTPRFDVSVDNAPDEQVDKEQEEEQEGTTAMVEDDDGCWALDDGGAGESTISHSLRKETSSTEDTLVGS